MAAGLFGLGGPGAACLAGAAEGAAQEIDGSVVVSRLVVRRIGEGKDARRIVILGRPRGVRDIPDYGPPRRPDMLPREMARQALLIAARDELGLATRDEVIDETPADGEDDVAGVKVLELASYVLDNRAHVLVRRREKGAIETILSHETPTPPGKQLDLVKLLEGAERLARDEFPRILKGMGLEASPKADKKDPWLPEKVEERLASLEFVDTLVAVRDLHRAIRTEGETPDRLGALARGYALLGILSEFQWHPAHRAYKARALLYAQRLLTRGTDRRAGLWNRAFALALVGRHGDALADLEAVKKEGGAQEAAPDWVEPIDALCRFDSTRLAQVEGKHAKLARLLRAFTLAFPLSTAAGLQAAKEVLLLQPYCFRAHDAMADYFGVSTQHVTNMIAPQRWSNSSRRGSSRSTIMPREAKEGLRRGRRRSPRPKQLDRRTVPRADDGEPAWGHRARRSARRPSCTYHRRLYCTEGDAGGPATTLDGDPAGGRGRR